MSWPRDETDIRSAGSILTARSDLHTGHGRLDQAGRESSMASYRGTKGTGRQAASFGAVFIRWQRRARDSGEDTIQVSGKATAAVITSCSASKATSTSEPGSRPHGSGPGVRLRHAVQADLRQACIIFALALRGREAALGPASAFRLVRLWRRRVLAPAGDSGHDARARRPVGQGMTGGSLPEGGVMCSVARRALLAASARQARSGLNCMTRFWAAAWATPTASRDHAMPG